MRARFILINKINIKDISEIKYPMLELKQIKLYLQTQCKELVKFYLQRCIYIYIIPIKHLFLEKLNYMNRLIETL
jgi:hypothetical protein